MKYINEKIIDVKNKKLVVTLMICIVSLLVILGGSYAAFYYFFDGNNSLIEVMPAELELLESDTNIINLENSLPMSDTEGMAQSETFDFAVTTKAGAGKDIEYSLYVEKIGKKCSTLDAPTRDEYPACYDFNISDANRDILIEYLESWGYNTEEATTYYELQVAGDKDGLINFYITVDGATAEEANSWVSYDEEDGYILYIIDSYENDTGTTLDVYDFNEENVIPSYPDFLDDEDVKIYLTDYEDNPLVGPIKISDLSDYKLFLDLNSHDDSTKKIQDKYKVRIWIDEELDISDWDENTNLGYKFKIGLKASEY